MKIEESKLETQNKQLQPIVINRLFELKRYNMKAYGCFGMASVNAIEDSLGDYVRWEDIEKLIIDISVSNN
jgi:hypothetical protein